MPTASCAPAGDIGLHQSSTSYYLNRALPVILYSAVGYRNDAFQCSAPNPEAILKVNLVNLAQPGSFIRTASVMDRKNALFC
jgi:hypothetical protein